MGRGSVSAFSSHLARILGLACGLAACSLPSLLVAQAGATVALPELGRTTLTDDLGRFEFRDVPAGSHRVLVSHTGLDPQERTLTVDAGGLAPVRFQMDSEVLRLQTIQVTTEAEGHAAAITRQRNSTNLISAAATDAFGALASQNPGEVFMRLPGVAATIGEDNERSAASIRGMASRMNAVTMDGALLAPVSSGATRQVRFTTNSTAQFEEFEVELLCREWTAGIPLEYNGTSATVAWSKGADLSSLVGRTLSLEFRSTRTKLYSFRFE